MKINWVPVLTIALIASATTNAILYDRQWERRKTAENQLIWYKQKYESSIELLTPDQMVKLMTSFD